MNDSVCGTWLMSVGGGLMQSSSLERCDLDNQRLAPRPPPPSLGLAGLPQWTHSTSPLSDTLSPPRGPLSSLKSLFFPVGNQLFSWEVATQQDSSRWTIMHLQQHLSTEFDAFQSFWNIRVFWKISSLQELFKDQFSKWKCFDVSI